MNIFNYKDAEKYLQNRQVYFRKEVSNRDLKTIAESDKVHNIGSVDIERLNDTTIALRIQINGIETPIYQYKTDLELFAWIKVNFIPVNELVDNWLNN